MSRREIIIIRGLPGSGKNSLAGKFSASEYVYISHDLSATSALALTRIVLVNNKFSPVIVGRFCRTEEFTPYRELSEEFNCPLMVVTCEGILTTPKPQNLESYNDTDAL